VGDGSATVEVGLSDNAVFFGAATRIGATAPSVTSHRWIRRPTRQTPTRGDVLI